MRALGSLLLVGPVVPAAQLNSTDDVVTRATRYVDDFVRRFPGVLAEERYVQEVAPPRRRRELKSEFLLVKPPDSNGWQQFRDVLEVDGRPVADRQERLTDLFLRPNDDAFRRAAEITRISARYNVAGIGTLNQPLMVLSFLQSRYRGRFRFAPQQIDASVSPRARVIRFLEVVEPTLLADGLTNRRSLFAAGRIWVDEESGTVLRTELAIDSANGRNEIQTIFGFNATLGVYVPVEMRERYNSPSTVTTGIATYSDFRRYRVETEERLR